MDRVNISVAVIEMHEELGWSTVEKGQILGAFFYGYLCSQFLGAFASQQYGGKFVLTVAVLGWSALTIFTPIAAQFGFIPLLLCRIALGFFEGVSFPTFFHIFGQFVPQEERSRSISFLTGGSFLGTTLAFCLCPLLMGHFGWHLVFYVCGSLGFVWVALWQAYMPASAPMQINYSAVQNEVVPGEEQSSFTQIKQMCSSPPILAIFLCHFAQNWGLYTMLAWMPTYFNDVLGADLNGSASLTCLPYISMMVTTNLGGYFCDQILLGKYEMDLGTARRTMTGAGYLISSTAFYYFAQVTEFYWALTLCCVALSGMCVAVSGFETNKLDVVSPSMTGLLQSTSNTIATMAGVLGVPIASFFIDSPNYGWPAVYQLTALLQLCAMVVYLMFSSGNLVYTDSARKGGIASTL